MWLFYQYVYIFYFFRGSFVVYSRRKSLFLRIQIVPNHEFQNRHRTAATPRLPGPPANNLLLLGSCFVENIGLWLQQRKFDVDINPFGTLVQPRIHCPQLGAHRLGQQLYPRCPVSGKRSVAQLRPPLALFATRPGRGPDRNEQLSGPGTRPSAGDRPHCHHLGQRLHLPPQSERRGGGQLSQATGHAFRPGVAHGRRHRGALAPHRPVHREPPACQPVALHR